MKAKFPKLLSNRLTARCHNRIIQKRIDYWNAYRKGYDDYLTELGLKCVKVGMWDIYFEHDRRRRLVVNLIRKLHNLKKT